MSLQNLAEERPIPEATAVQDWAATFIRTAIDDLKAPYPRRRLRRCKSGGYGWVKGAALAAERRQFAADFTSSLSWIFGDRTGFDLVADSLRELDVETIRRGATAILEERRYASWGQTGLFLPEHLVALWRAHKRRMNFGESAQHEGGHAT